MASNMKETLIQRLTAHIKEQLVENGITDFKIDDGNFYFTNADEKSRANTIIRDYITYMLDNDPERLM